MDIMVGKNALPRHKVKSIQEAGVSVLFCFTVSVYFYPVLFHQRFWIANVKSTSVCNKLKDLIEN